MSKNTKLIFLILVIFVVASAFITASMLSQKTALEKEKSRLEGELAQYKDREQKLSQENKKIGDQLIAAQNSQSKLQKQLSELNDKITALTADRDDWKSKVDDIKKERDQLIVKLQEKPEAPPPAPVVQPQIPQQPEVVNVPATEGNEKYWAGVLKEKASLELKLSELQNQASTSGVETEELKKKVSDLEIELGQLKNEKEEIERKIKYSEDLTNTLSIELAREKNDKRYVADRADKLKEENLNLRAQVKELTAAKIVLEKNIAKLSSDKDDVEKRLAQTESIIQNRIDEVLDIKKNLDTKLQSSSSLTGSKEVELPPIIVNAPGPEVKQGPGNLKNNQANPQAPGLNGRVISINNDNNFVIVDVGEDGGIRVGDTLSVYRGSKYIAGLEVIQIRKDICAADIKQKGAKIAVGDVVR